MWLRSVDKQYVNRLFLLFNCEQIDIIVLLDLRFPSTQTSTWDMRHSPTLFSLNIIKPYQLLTNSCWLWWEIAHLFGDSTHLCFSEIFILCCLPQPQVPTSQVRHIPQTARLLAHLPVPCFSPYAPEKNRKYLVPKQSLFVYFCNYYTKYTLDSKRKILQTVLKQSNLFVFLYPWL